MIKVRKHIRKTKGGASVVRKHSRKVRRLYKDLSDRATKNTSVDLSHKAEGTSLAHTDTHLKKGEKKPVKHEVKVDVKKAEKAGQSVDQVLAHEFGHILDRDRVDIKNTKTALSSSKAASPLMRAIKKSKAFQLIKGDKYASAKEEMFARAYSQYKTGNSSEVKSGLGWSKKDFGPIKTEMKKLLSTSKKKK